VRAFLAFLLGVLPAIVPPAVMAQAVAAPVVIAHRGASGYLPEHTLAGYYVAIQQGAAYIEPDLVMTKDGVLVARHENEIGETTDVAARAEYSSRKTTKTIDGQPLTGWFTEDFTLAELKTLRAKERIPSLRPANARFDGMFEIPTFDEVLALLQGVNASRRERGLKPVGVYPETKHPSYFAARGLAMEAALVASLQRHGYRGRQAPVFIQSFEVGNLMKLAKMTDVPLVQLLGASGKPWDFAEAGDPRTYADLSKPAGLAMIARYASGIGAHKDLMIPRKADGTLGEPTALVREAHAAGLVVHGWTFRAENYFLPAEHRAAGAPPEKGDLAGELKRFLALGMDGFFTDQPDLGVRAAAR